jgi:hypothetical protein
VDWPDVNITQFYSEYVFSSVFSPLSGPETGTYLKCTGDLTITDDVRITGMLVVEGDLQITGTNNLLTAVKNAPALFVAGDITIDPDAEINIEGLAVVDGAVYVNVGCEDVNVIGGLFAGDGIIERAKDISSNNFDAIVRSEPDWQPAGGQIAGAAEFDGYDDKLEEYSIDSSLNGLSAITVTCWVKSNVTNQDRGIFFTKAPSEGDEELGLRYDKDGASGHADSGIKASIRTTSGYSQIETDSHTQTTSWQHLALVWESGQYLKLYINGLEHTPKYLTPSSFPLTGTVTGVQKFMLGCGTKGRYWDGLIDDVRIYSRALDSGEIQLVKSGLSTTGLLAHWQLDEDGQREVVITAAPAKTALWCFSTTGDRERWAQAGTAFYKMIKRY